MDIFYIILRKQTQTKKLNFFKETSNSIWKDKVTLLKQERVKFLREKTILYSIIIMIFLV